jgi:hypothetical protein
MLQGLGFWYCDKLGQGLTKNDVKRFEELQDIIAWYMLVRDLLRENVKRYCPLCDEFLPMALAYRAICWLEEAWLLA